MHGTHNACFTPTAIQLCGRAYRASHELQACHFLSPENHLAYVCPFALIRLQLHVARKAHHTDACELAENDTHVEIDENECAHKHIADKPATAMC